jgi:hypothetical protein
MVYLCQYKDLSCVRCCLPHIGGDAYIDIARGGYLGPGNVLMRFKTFGQLNNPKFEASGYEDALPDVGRDEMEKRFSERRTLFLQLYDNNQPRQSLTRYMGAIQNNEGYNYAHVVNAGPASLYIGGTVSKNLQKGELPECHLLGFVDGQGRVGCMAHPQAETSQGYDGRDQAGFFHHTGCCGSVSCDASREFQLLSSSAMKVFDKAVHGMSWHEYSMHSTSVLVFYLRGCDGIVQTLDQRGLLDSLSLKQLVAYTNAL